VGALVAFLVALTLGRLVVALASAPAGLAGAVTFHFTLESLYRSDGMQPHARTSYGAWTRASSSHFRAHLPTIALNSLARTSHAQRIGRENTPVPSVIGPTQAQYATSGASPNGPWSVSVSLGHRQVPYPQGEAN